MPIEQALAPNISQMSNEISSSILKNIPINELRTQLAPLITIGKIALILSIAYLILLIIQKLFSIRDSMNIKTIKNNVIEINKKLDKHHSSKN